MQEEGKVNFLKFHNGIVRGVAFSPTDRYLFCSGGLEGKINLYSALRSELLMSYQLTALAVTKNINTLRFTIDGSKILAATTGRRLAVVDVERGEQLLAYENCVSNGRERVSVATDPICPSIAACVSTNGKGLSLLDLRVPLPLEFFYDIHSSNIRDLTFLHPSWPWTLGNSCAILSAGSDGTVNVSGLDGRCLHSFHTANHLNAICPTPELFTKNSEKGFQSLIMCGSHELASYIPDCGMNQMLHQKGGSSILKLRYTSNGSFLYAACEDGNLRRYRRYPNHHELLCEVYSHKGEIQDLDISPYDEYLITASKDKTVGILKLGAPSHGWTEYSELT